MEEKGKRQTKRHRAEDRSSMSSSWNEEMALEEKEEGGKSSVASSVLTEQINKC